MKTTAQLLLEADKQRPRTQQVEIGMSDLGGCRKRAGYKLALTPHVNQAGSIQAAIGTAVHDLIERMLAGMVEPGDLVEHEVTFAGIVGHLDRYEAASRTVRDTKTTSARWLEHIKLHGAEDGHWWQVACNAAGLIQQGIPVEYVAIEYLARDTGEEYVVSKPFDPADVRDALQWLKNVRDTPLDALPRDYDPDSQYCRGCPYGGLDGGLCWEGHIPGRDLRSVLYVEDPDAGKWAQQLWEARYGASAVERKRAETDAKGALSAIVDPGGVPTRCGAHWLRYDAAGRLRFVSEPRETEIGP